MGAPAFRDYVTGENVHISARNSKLGNIPSFSTLPGSGLLTLSDGRHVVNCSGTCSGAACQECDATNGGACYAGRVAKYRANTARAWADNTIIARSDMWRIYDAVRLYCAVNVVPFFRIHVSGEFFSLEYIEMWADLARIAEHNPVKTVFYGYTQRADLLEEYAQKHGAFPDNLVIMLSAWGDVDNATNAPMFIIDDGRGEYASMPHCPAYDENGRSTGIKCASCLHCAKALEGSKICVYKHGAR